MLHNIVLGSPKKYLSYLGAVMTLAAQGKLSIKSIRDILESGIYRLSIDNKALIEEVLIPEICIAIQLVYSMSISGIKFFSLGAPDSKSIFTVSKDYFVKNFNI